MLEFSSQPERESLILHDASAAGSALESGPVEGRQFVGQRFGYK